MGWTKFLAYSGTSAVIFFGSYYYITQDSVQHKIRQRVEHSSSRTPSPERKEYMRVLKEAAHMKENIIWKQAHEKRSSETEIIEK